MTDIQRARVLLSLQRALLGAVTSDLRAVSVRWTPTRITGRFIYDDGADLEERFEIVHEVETLVIADHDDHVEVEFVVSSLPRGVAPVLDYREVWAFLRRNND